MYALWRTAMKLTGDLKNQVEKAESKDEKKKLIEEAGMELTEKELDMVSGGGFGGGLFMQTLIASMSSLATLEKAAIIL